MKVQRIFFICLCLSIIFTGCTMDQIVEFEEDELKIISEQEKKNGW